MSIVVVKASFVTFLVSCSARCKIREHALSKSDFAPRPAYEIADTPDEEYPDAMICQKTIEDLRQLSTGDSPFFLACGFHRPHLPFHAPKKYWDLYPETEVKLPNNMYFPQGLSSACQYSWGEMRAYRGIPDKDPVSDETA
ncbi:hypothetical protein Q31b_02740 [Novipirellula aureliae]|uniref:Sulfatase N-terminal domain-containing protein n=1 Tax=Novipirellula aureliae TaxID=2527966 RepID=A0A5C6E602_9BACT|nr:hypothetical protein [Novipirellula aureliae]TWU45103.1 hypothetical protein Q31b_02740 [Novipirellula aureliae]